MKKVIVSLGFAAATIIAANAQQVTPEDQTTTAPQQTQDAAIQDDQTRYPDQAQQDAASMQDEQAVPTESTDPALQGPVEQPVVESQDAETQVNSTLNEDEEETTRVTNPDQQQPDAATMQDEQTMPAESAEPAESTSPQESVNQSTSQSQDDAQASDSQEAQVETITEADLPEEVTKALEESEYSEGTIENVYLLKEEAVNKLMQSDAAQTYAGDITPDKIYQLQVKGEDETNILYYDEEGELVGSTSI